MQATENEREWRDGRASNREGLARYSSGVANSPFIPEEY